jgi:hypothetical protein
MKEVYNKLNELTREVEHYTNHIIEDYASRLEEIKNYCELHDIDETLREDIIALADNKAERVCSHCSKPMSQGYVIENGLEYYCCDDCLHKVYTDEEYNKLYDNGNGDSYWTEW